MFMENMDDIGSFTALLLVPLLFHFGAADEERYPSPLMFTKFDGNLKDYTGKNADPSVVNSNSVGFVVGPYDEPDGAVYINGGVYLEWQNGGTDGPLYFKDEYTIMFWIKNYGSPLGAIFAYYTQNQISFELWEWNQENMLFIRHTSGPSFSNSSHTIANTFSTAEWVHVAVTYQKSSGYNRLYRNGVEFWRATKHYGDFRTDMDVVRMGRRRGQDQSLNAALSCLQVYDVYMTYREISKASGLCRPQYASLHPWPKAMGLWPLNGRFGAKNMMSGMNGNDGEMFGSYSNSGPYGDMTGSYVLRGNADSYLEIDNSNHKVGPLNSFTFSLWLYPMDENHYYPLFNYEHGTESTPDPTAFHIWAFNGLYCCTPFSCSRTGAFISHRWNQVALSYDFSSGSVYVLIDGEEHEMSLSNSGTQLQTQLADGIRIGRTFHDSNTTYMNARIACVQIYDVPMSFQEMRGLGDRCEKVERKLDGIPSDLALMFPFNKQSQCSSIVPSARHIIYNSDCVLSRSGPRKRAREAVTLKVSSITSDRVLLKRVGGTPRPEQDTSFTLMFYIRLDMVNDLTAKVGFLKTDDSPSSTWLSLSTSGELEFEAGGLTTSDEEILTMSTVYTQSEADWIHLAISCNRLSARCYIFRNGSFIGESIEDVRKNWFFSNDMFIELSSGNENATAEFSCLQLYTRDLSKTEIITSRDRCMQKGDKTRHPLPVGFWPLDKVYKSREITGRSKAIEWTGSLDVTYQDDDPFGSSQGSMFRGGAGANGKIPANSGTDVRHSLSLQVYIRVHNHVIMPFFTYKSRHGPRAIRLFIYDLDQGDGPLLHSRVIGLNGDISMQSNYMHSHMKFDSWVRVAVTYDYSTSVLRNYVDGVLMDEVRVKDELELFTTVDVNIGYIWNEVQFNNGVFSMTCVQLYNCVLSAEQLDNAAKLCHYSHTGNYHFMTPSLVAPGYTQSSDMMNSTIMVRSRLECMQSCGDNDNCLALNYMSDSRECQLTSLSYLETGADTFGSTGGIYLEKVHPLLAEAL